MKRLLISIFTIFIISNSFSQELKFEKPNYKKISKEIKKKKSEFYYKNLFDRYLNGDTTFNLNEKRHLYYGFSFQDDYSPYGSSSYNDSLKVFYEKDTLTEFDFNEITVVFHYEKKNLHITILCCIPDYRLQSNNVCAC
jgi:hypothetical protein